jgi:hypothetical protein
MIIDKNFSLLLGYQIPAHSLGSKIFVPLCFLAPLKKREEEIGLN